MSLFADTRVRLSPAVEELLEGYDSSSPLPLRGRELAVEAGSAALFLATSLAIATLVAPQRLTDVPLALTFVAAYALVSRIRFAVGHGFTVPTQLIFVPMLFLLPAGAVPLLVAAGILLGGLPDYARGRLHPSRALIGLGDAWHAVGPALVIGLAGITAPELARWPVLLAALAAQLLGDNLASTLREWLGLGISPGLQPSLLGWVGLVDVLLSPVGLLAAIASDGAPYTVLLVLPLCGLLAVFAAERAARVSQALELSRAYRGTTLLLSDVLEADDEYTGIHSRGVVALSVAVADELGLSSTERRHVEFGALLHDVGKIAVPKEIINKPGPLDDDEWVVIKAHTIEGQRMLDQVGGLLSDVGKIVRSSHESWDGSGYPDGLVGEQIPLGASIVSACDAFNAITTDRPYRPARSLEEAITELRAESGRQFNPRVVEVLTRVLEQPRPGHEPHPAATVTLAPSGV